MYNLKNIGFRENGSLVWKRKCTKYGMQRRIHIHARVYDMV